MQLRRVSLAVFFSLIVCSLLFAQQQPCTKTTQQRKSKTVSTRYKKPTAQRVETSRVEAPRQDSPLYTSWQMDRLKSREKVTNDIIARLEKELEQYRQERAEIRRGMNDLIAKEVQERLEARLRLEKEQQEQLNARDKEIEELKRMQNEVEQSITK